MPKKMTQDEFIARSNIVHNFQYDYTQVQYVNSSTLVTIICRKHGAFQQTPYIHLRGGGCQKCGREKVSDKLRGSTFQRETHDHDAFVAEASRVHHNHYTYPFVQYAKDLYAICSEHGPFKISNKREHLKGAGCQQCDFESRATTHEDFIARANAIHSHAYDYPEPYTNLTTPITIVCKQHGTFQQKPREHLRGHGCRVCALSGISVIEQRLADALPSFQQSNRTALDGWEVDLYDEQASLAIEVNGMYWHNEDNLPPSYHLDKLQRAEARSIRLLQFTEDELHDSFDLIVSMIEAKRGNAQPLYARQCDIGTITKEQARDFLDANHLQGFCPASHYYGLFRYMRLVAVMTFGKARFKNGADYELLRYANNQGIRVIGGASRLLAYHRKRNPGSIISYANRRWSDGNLYRKLGFKELEPTPPSYIWWHGSGKTLTRYQTMKHLLPVLLKDKFNPEQSEVENMRANGWARIFDCGNRKFWLD